MTTLLQLLVFEHKHNDSRCPVDVTVQVEAGEITLFKGLAGTGIFLSTNYTDRVVRLLFTHENVREVIDKAVAEQFRQTSELPYIYPTGKQFPRYRVATRAGFSAELGEGVYQALCEIAGKELPVMGTAPKPITSTWTKVFPPDMKTPILSYDTVTSAFDNLTVGYNDCVGKMEQETAFTVWRLTVTKEE